MKMNKRTTDVTQIKLKQGVLASLDLPTDPESKSQGHKTFLVLLDANAG